MAYGAGYYAGCRVLFDRNGNGREDEGEPANTTATAASGEIGSGLGAENRDTNEPTILATLAPTLSLSLT